MASRDAANAEPAGVVDRGENGKVFECWGEIVGRGVIHALVSIDEELGATESPS